MKIYILWKKTKVDKNWAWDLYVNYMIFVLIINMCNTIHIYNRIHLHYSLEISKEN